MSQEDTTGFVRPDEVLVRAQYAAQGEIYEMIVEELGHGDCVCAACQVLDGVAELVSDARRS